MIRRRKTEQNPSSYDNMNDKNTVNPISSDDVDDDLSKPLLNTNDKNDDDDGGHVTTTANNDNSSKIESDDDDNNDDGRWNHVYNSPPIISQNQILVFGIILFTLSYIWRPMIMILFYVASIFIPYAFRQNDDAVFRRIEFKKFMKCKKHSNILHNIQNYCHFQERYWENDRGMLLCTSIMTPKDMPIKSVVCYCHGYTDHSSFAKRIEYQRLLKAGIALITIEYEGHGRSDGPLGLISSWDNIIHDVTSFFQETITCNIQFHDKKIFLMGESMGGAVVYCVYNKLPNLFNGGVIFVCPMCKVKDDMLPPKFVVDAIKPIAGPTGTVSLIGYLPIAPAKKLENLTFRIPEIGSYIRTSPTCFSGRKPRIATAREILLTSKYVSDHLHEFKAPFLVIHGKEDKVTDPALSQLLYDEAKSIDKSIKLYDGLWHALTSGETNDNMNMVFNDVIEWILKRS